MWYIYWNSEVKYINGLWGGVSQEFVSESLVYFCFFCDLVKVFAVVGFSKHYVFEPKTTGDILVFNDNLCLFWV